MTRLFKDFPTRVDLLFCGFLILVLALVLGLPQLTPEERPTWEQQYARHPVAPEPPAQWVEASDKQWRYDPPGPFLVVVNRGTPFVGEQYLVWTLWYGGRVVMEGHGSSLPYCQSQSITGLRLAESCDPSQFQSLPRPPYGP